MPTGDIELTPEQAQRVIAAASAKPSILQRLLKPFTVSTTATGDFLDSLLERPGELMPALERARKGASDAWNDRRTNSPSEASERFSGTPLPTAAGFIVDAAIDPTNFADAPIKALAALPILASTAKFGRRAEDVAELGKAAKDAMSGTARATMERATKNMPSDRRFSELMQKFGGLRADDPPMPKPSALAAADNVARNAPFGEGSIIPSALKPTELRTMMDEAGQMPTSVAINLGASSTGAAAGAAADDENRLRGAAIGAAAGLGAGAIAGRVAKGFIPAATQAVEEVAPAGAIAKRVPGLGDVQRAVTDGAFFPEKKLGGATPKPTMGQLARDDEKLFPFLAKHTGLTPETRKEVADLFFEGDNFWKQRRMGLTWEQANQLADDVALKVDLPKGTALNQEHTLALRSSAMGLMDQATEVAKAADAFEKAADPAILAKFGAKSQIELRAIAEESRLKATAALQSMAGVRSEAGRALNSYKQLRRAREMGDMDFIQKALEKGANAEQAFKAVVNFGDDKVAQYRYLRDLAKPTGQDLWKWYFKTNLLSGPKTHVRNLFGNSSNLAFEFASTALRNPSEAKAQVPGLWAGMRSGLEKASFMMKNGFSTEQAAQFADRAPEVFGGNKVANFVGRSLESADEFFRTIAFEMNRHGLAYEAAAKKGLKGPQLWDEAARLITDTPPEMVKASADHAAKVVYRAPSDKVTQKLHGLIQSVDNVTVDASNALAKKGLIKEGGKLHSALQVPFGTFVMPFISTPMNILKQGYLMTPAGAIHGTMRGGREGAQMVAKSAVGSGLLAFAAMLAAEGKLTGSGPTDPNERDQFWADKQPNSIKIGDRWVSYQQLAPLAFPLSMVGNAFETYRKGGDVSGAEIFAKTANSVLSQSYLSGMMGLVEAITRAETHGDKFVGRALTGFIPASGLMRNIRSAVDPVVRDPDGLVENVKNAIPGLSTDVPQRVDFAGQVPKLRGSAVERFISPVEQKPAAEDQTRKALVEADAYYSKPPKSLRGERGTTITLTDQQQVQLQKLYGRAMEQALSKLTQNDNFRRLPVERRKSLIDSTKRNVSQQVREAFRRRLATEPR